MTNRSVTYLLSQARAGNTVARDQLFGVVYAELRRLAARHMRGERQDHTLQPTALVHEVYVRLFQDSAPEWNDRAHFFAMASTEMRRILVDYARRHHAKKRGGSAARRVTLTDVLAYSKDYAADIIALDIALDQLSAVKPDAARIVEMTYFGGMTQSEAAEILGCSERTVKRQWVFARSFLLDQLSPGRI
jgi:RNA polymerase sigma factor (TIGR02999 family)